MAYEARPLALEWIAANRENRSLTQAIYGKNSVIYLARP